MKILVLNAGSSSIKYQLINMQTETLLAKGLVERIGIAGSQLTHKANKNVFEVKQPIANHTEGLKLVLDALVSEKMGVIKNLSEISAIGHRILHGGGKYNKATLVTPEVIEDLETYIPLGPLHMPANISGIKACQSVMPHTPNVCVFDTAFHATMPNYAYMYAVPYSWCKDYGVRKYGFHGTSHEFIANEFAKELGKKPEDLKMISCHIGNGASLCAIKNGKCVDTSMGFTPLEGLMMGTRSGDIDPAVVEFVCTKTGKTVHEVLGILNKQSGLLGLSEESSDIRDVLKKYEQGDEKAQVAIAKFVYVIKKYIGAYAAAMGGVDAIAFTAGTGENRAEIREWILQGLDFLGVDLDKDRNNNFERGVNYRISKTNSKVAVYVIPTDEELSIARQTKQVVEK